MQKTDSFKIILQKSFSFSIFSEYNPPSEFIICHFQNVPIHRSHRSQNPQSQKYLGEDPEE